MEVQHADQITFDLEADVAVVGAGGCGMTAALAAAQHGVQVLLLEKEHPEISRQLEMEVNHVPYSGT